MKRYAILTLLASTSLWAHGAIEHSKAIPKQQSKAEENAKKYTQIDTAYTKSIKPIFQAKCFSCHAQKPKNMPWYYSIPGAKQLIDYDMKEAKKHLDFRKGFPFASHGTPITDLKSLKDTISSGNMPPLRYRIIHWDSALNKKEVKTINAWIKESLKALE